ncbi:hypothetical protein [Halorientalis salina]|uniref:hypothetical protein n=1 Tax=Halorientalis salina TaxID=2932266 RepID=UPI0010AD4EB5|nr:hypothetical protein [Halorientalis salina]
MSNTDNDEALSEIVAFNLNPYVLGILVLAVGLWVFGHTEYGTLAFLLFLLIFTLRNMWFAYSELLG